MKNTLLGVGLGAVVIGLLWVMATIVQPARAAEDVCYQTTTIPWGQNDRVTRVRYRPCP